MSGQISLPRPAKNPDSPSDKSLDRSQKFSRYSHADLKFSKSFDDDYHKPSSSSSNIAKYLEKPVTKFSDNKYLQRQKSMVNERGKEGAREDFRKSLERDLLNKSGNRYLEKSLSNSEQFYDEDRYYYNDKSSPKYFEDDGFDENIRSRNGSADLDKDRPSRSFSYEEEVFFEEQKPMKQYPVPKARQKYVDDDAKFRGPKTKSNPNDPRYYEPRGAQKPIRSGRDFDRDEKKEFSFSSNADQFYYEGTSSINRRQPQYRQRSPTPDEIKAPRDRFKDAKEKFLLMEKERLEHERRNPEPPISPTIQRDKIHFVKRHQSMAYPSKDHLRSKFDDRYSNDRHEFTAETRPTPAPRYSEEVRYRQKDRDGLRSADKYDPKRRSMFSLIEEEHKKNSSEIAKELKRRSYIEFGQQGFEDEDCEERDLRSSRHYQDLPEADRYNSLLMESVSKSNEQKYDAKFAKNPQRDFKGVPGYRHSYAEPKLKMEQKKKTTTADMLHRTNSTVGYLPPRVGIASMHPY
ncbi:hypothetical protein HUJ05_006065 [Dendroctonus ponderosae]|nr:hypothetical protein HUJ05_006065 [Dendroctonus ponderosae]